MSVMFNFSIVLSDKSTKQCNLRDVSLLILGDDTHIHFKDGTSFIALEKGFRYGSQDVSHVDYYNFLDAILYFAKISDISTAEMRVYEMPTLREEEWTNKMAQYEKDMSEEGCIGCGESYGCGAQGYCGLCWNDRYGDGNDNDNYY